MLETAGVSYTLLIYLVNNFIEEPYVFAIVLAI